MRSLKQWRSWHYMLDNIRDGANRRCQDEEGTKALSKKEWEKEVVSDD